MITELGNDTIDQWIALGSVATTPADVRAAIESSPSIRRFLVSSRGQYVGRFSAGFGKHDMTIWWPTLRRDVRHVDIESILREIAFFLVELAQQVNLPLVECTLPQDATRPDDWPSALIAAGFRWIERKTEWRATLPLRARETSSPLRIECRSAGLGDRDLVSRLYRASLTKTLDKALLLESLHGGSVDHGDEAVLAYIGDKCVGLLLSTREPFTEAWIRFVGVVPASRNQGVATALISHVSDMFVRDGISELRSLISNDNLPSIMVHQRLGFTKTAASGDVYCWSAVDWS